MRLFSVLFALFLSLPAGAYPNGPEISDGNSTTTALASGATFTGSWEECYFWPTISVSVTTDLDGTLLIQFSPDATNADSQLSYDIKAGTVEPPHKLEIFRRYCRVKFTNDGGTTQSYLRLQTIYSDRGVPIAPLNLSVHQDADAIMTKQLDQEFLIGTGGLQGVSKVNKFGENTDVDSGTVPEDIWGGATGGVYTGFPTGSAETVEVFSASVNDDEGGSGCEKVRIYGISGGIFADEELTLNGTSAVTSSATYTRIYRVVCTQSANGANTSFNDGILTVRHSSTTANVFALVTAGTNQSRFCGMSVPSDKTGYLRDWQVMVSKNQTANIAGALWIRESGKPPRLRRNFTASDSNEHEDYIYSAIELPAGTDIIVRITSASTTNVLVTCLMDIFFVDNI